MATNNDVRSAPEKLRYTRYYEHDGMLRAYANRAMVLAMVFGVIALSSFRFRSLCALATAHGDPCG